MIEYKTRLDTVISMKFINDIYTIYSRQYRMFCDDVSRVIITLLNIELRTYFKS